MTLEQAINYCTTRYNEACDKYPVTRELGLTVYLKRNVPTIMKWRNSAEYTTVQRANEYRER